MYFFYSQTHRIHRIHHQRYLLTLRELSQPLMKKKKQRLETMKQKSKGKVSRLWKINQHQASQEGALGREQKRLDGRMREKGEDILRIGVQMEHVQGFSILSVTHSGRDGIAYLECKFGKYKFNMLDSTPSFSLETESPIDDGTSSLLFSFDIPNLQCSIVCDQGQSG